MIYEDLKTRFALEPYITPTPQEKTSGYGSEFTSENTLLTLFLNLDNRSNIINEKEFLPKLDQLEQNLPRQYKLQSEKLSLPIPNDTDQNSVSSFKFALADPTIHPYNLCPVPNIEVMTLHELLEHCVQCNIAASKAAWAVHFYIKKNPASPDLTEAFKALLVRDPSKASFIQRFNFSYISKFAYELYMTNLLRHEDILLYLMDNLPPANMAIFKNEILSTYSILLKFLTQSKNKKEYLDLFRNELQITRSQLVQLGLYPFSSEFVKELQNNETENRIKSLNDALCPYRLSYSTHYRNLIFRAFPIIDANIIEENMLAIMKYATDDEKQELAMTMCQSVLWFPSNKEAVAATVAVLVKRLVPNFQCEKFYRFLFKNSKIIESYRCLFLEFQLQKIFDYKDFLHYVIKKGFITNYPEESAAVISNLPSINVFVFKQIEFFMNQLFPGNNFVKQISSIYSDLIGNVDKIIDLPYVFCFQMVLLLFVSNQKKFEFGKFCSILQKTDTLSLITVLFEKNKPPKFTVFDFSFIEKTIPCFIAHNLLDSLAEVALPPENPNYTISELIARYLKESEDCNVKSCLSKYKPQLPLKKQSSKNMPISTKNLQDFIVSHSYACSLHIFDLFFSVQQECELKVVFCQLLCDLLNFPLLTDDLLFELFVDFCESQTIQKGADQFIKYFMKTIISNPSLVEDEDSNSRKVITNFLTLLFRSYFIYPSSYLQVILSPRHRSSGNSNDHLINIFFNIIKDNPNSFPVESILSENVIANINDQELYMSLLEQLRQFPPPIITDSLRNVLTNKIPSQISAAYYSLLPLGLQALDFNDVFDYYAKNVDHTTSTFWTLWLRYKVFYNSGFPVTPCQADNQQRQDHIIKLWTCFYKLILQNDYDLSNPEIKEKLQIYLNCWTLLCMDSQDQFTNVISSKTATNIKYEKPLIKPLQIDFLHPVINNCNEAYLEQICDGFCKYQFSENSGKEFDEECVTLMRIASYTFVTFANRFIKKSMQSTAIVKSMADKLLVWLKSILNNEYRQTEIFVLDAFNFIVTKTAEMEFEQNRDFHEHILKSLEQFPPKIRKYILVNFIMQSFVKVQDPDYFNYTAPHQDTNSTPFGIDNEPFSAYDIGSFDIGGDNLDSWNIF